MESITLGYGYISPCKGCEKRSVGCHSTCEAYTKSKTEYDEKTAAVKKDTLLQHETVSYFIKQQDSIKKRKRGGWGGKE